MEPQMIMDSFWGEENSNLIEDSSSSESFHEEREIQIVNRPYFMTLTSSLVADCLVAVKPLPLNDCLFHVCRFVRFSHKKTAGNYFYAVVVFLDDANNNTIETVAPVYKFVEENRENPVLQKVKLINIVHHSFTLLRNCRIRVGDLRKIEQGLIS